MLPNKNCINFELTNLTNKRIGICSQETIVIGYCELGIKLSLDMFYSINIQNDKINTNNLECKNNYEYDKCNIHLFDLKYNNSYSNIEKILHNKIELSNNMYNNYSDIINRCNVYNLNTAVFCNFFDYRNELNNLDYVGNTLNNILEKYDNLNNIILNYDGNLSSNVFLLENLSLLNGKPYIMHNVFSSFKSFKEYNTHELINFANTIDKLIENSDLCNILDFDKYIDDRIQTYMSHNSMYDVNSSNNYNYTSKSILNILNNLFFDNKILNNNVNNIRDITKILAPYPRIKFCSTSFISDDVISMNNNLYEYNNLILDKKYNLGYYTDTSIDNKLIGCYTILKGNYWNTNHCEKLNATIGNKHTYNNKLVLDSSIIKNNKSINDNLTITSIINNKSNLFNNECNWLDILKSNKIRKEINNYFNKYNIDTIDSLIFNCDDLKSDYITINEFMEYQ